MDGTDITSFHHERAKLAWLCVSVAARFKGIKVKNF
jgi:hypothetical protein